MSALDRLVVIEKARCLGWFCLLYRSCSMLPTTFSICVVFLIPRVNVQNMNI